MLKRVSVIILVAAIIGTIPSPAFAAVGADVINDSNNCAHMTAYIAKGHGYNIEKSGAMAPGQQFFYSAHVMSIAGVTLKVRAQVYAGSQCGGSTIADVSFVTDLSNDNSKLIRRPGGEFQILRR
jgi:hypothetical protein